MGNWYVAVAVGVGLGALALGMMWGHWRSWQKQKNDTTVDNREHAHYYVKFQRRMQTSGLILLLSILIPIGDSPLIWRQGPLVWTCYWIAVLSITMWIALLAIGDFTATRARGKIDLARLQQKQRELESQLVQIKSRRSNGRQQPH